MNKISKFEENRIFRDLYIDNFKDWIKGAINTIENIEYFHTTLRDSLIRKEKPLIHPSASIHPTSVLEKDVIIGPNVQIGPHSYIGTETIICENTKIGYNVEIIKSLILKKNKIMHTACIGNSLIGEKCNLGAGFIVATRRLDGKKIKVEYSNEKSFHSKRTHYGIIIGANVQIGIQIIAMPGSVVGAKSIIFPSSIISGYIRPGYKGHVDVSWKRKE